MLVCSGGTTDDVLRTARSAICSGTTVVLLVAEVLVEEETVLVVSGFLSKKVTIPHGSAMPNEDKEMVLSSGILAATWCS